MDKRLGNLEKLILTALKAGNFTREQLVEIVAEAFDRTLSSVRIDVGSAIMEMLSFGLLDCDKEGRLSLHRHSYVKDAMEQQSCFEDKMITRFKYVVGKHLQEAITAKSCKPASGRLTKKDLQTLCIKKCIDNPTTSDELCQKMTTLGKSVNSVGAEKLSAHSKWRSLRERVNLKIPMHKNFKAKNTSQRQPRRTKSEQQSAQRLQARQKRKAQSKSPKQSKKS